MALAARAKGAGQIIVTDLVDAPLEVAKRLRRRRGRQRARRAGRLERYKAGKGHFDVGVEAAGVVPALATLFDIVRAGGVIVQVGMLPPGEVPVPANRLMAREIDYVGAFQFHGEYGRAVRLLGSGPDRRRAHPDPRPAARARRGGVRACCRPLALDEGPRPFLGWQLKGMSLRTRYALFEGTVHRWP